MKQQPRQKEPCPACGLPLGSNNWNRHWKHQHDGSVPPFPVAKGPIHHQAAAKNGPYKQAVPLKELKVQLAYKSPALARYNNIELQLAAERKNLESDLERLEAEATEIRKVLGIRPPAVPHAPARAMSPTLESIQLSDSQT